MAEFRASFQINSGTSDVLLLYWTAYGVNQQILMLGGICFCDLTQARSKVCPGVAFILMKVPELDSRKEQDRGKLFMFFFYLTFINV